MTPIALTAADAKAMLDRVAAHRKDLPQLLIDHGRPNVHYLQGRFDAWRRAGFDLESK